MGGTVNCTPANWVVLASRLAGRYGITSAIYLCLTLRARWSSHHDCAKNKYVVTKVVNIMARYDLVDDSTLPFARWNKSWLHLPLILATQAIGCPRVLFAGGKKRG